MCCLYKRKAWPGFNTLPPKMKIFINHFLRFTYWINSHRQPFLFLFILPSFSSSLSSSFLSSVHSTIFLSPYYVPVSAESSEGFLISGRFKLEARDSISQQIHCNLLRSAVWRLWTLCPQPNTNSSLLPQVKAKWSVHWVRSPHSPVCVAGGCWRRGGGIRNFSKAS